MILQPKANQGAKQTTDQPISSLVANTQTQEINQL
jgi:hypothetical protein